LRPLSDSQMAALETAVASYQSQLTLDAAQYLHNRGVDQKVATTFRLGVITNPTPGHGRYRGMLAIPYLDKDGHPLTIRFRCPHTRGWLPEHDHRANGHGKYNSMKDDPSRVFNISAIHTAIDEIHIAEGEFDAMILNKIGLPAVAIPGAHGWQYHHRRMLAGFSRVFVWGDPDDAGAEFVTKVVASMRTAKGVSLKTGDVTETYMQGGAEALLALINRKVK
jgi:DNA primase